MYPKASLRYSGAGSKGLHAAYDAGLWGLRVGSKQDSRTQRAQYPLIKEYGLNYIGISYYDLELYSSFPERTPIDPVKEPFKEPLSLKLYSLIKGVLGSLGTCRGSAWRAAWLQAFRRLISASRGYLSRCTSRLIPLNPKPNRLQAPRSCFCP